MAGKAAKFASVEGFSYARSGFGVDLGIEKLALTGTAAKLLNVKLGFAKAKAAHKPFAGKQRLGWAASSTQPLTVTILPTGTAKLVPDTETTTKLIMAGATVEPIAPAGFEFGPPPALTLPISGGLLAPNGSIGVLQTLGGQKVSKGPASTITSNLWLDLGLKVATAGCR